MAQTSSNKFIVNITSNFLSIGVNLVIGIFMAPFLIGKLGIEMFGIIALVNTFPAYIQIFTNGLSNSSTRFMSISMEKKKLEDANNYFCTSYMALSGLIIVLIPLVILLAFFTPKIFNIPVDGEVDSQILVLLVLMATLFNILQAPFGSVYQVYHKFSEKNIITIFSKLIAVVLLIGLFFFFLPKVWYVGIYQLSIALISGWLLFKNYSKFQKMFIVKKGSFKVSALKELGGLGFWNSVNEVAVLFFLMANQVLINHFLGVKESGFFGPVLILISLLMMGSGAISNVLMPIIYRDIATQKKSLDIENKLFFISKVLSYVIGIPIIIFLLYSNEIIYMWLGDEFLRVVPVMQLFIVSLFLGGIIYLPYSHFFRGHDKMKIPAIINFGFGVLNLILVIMSFYLDYALMGVAYSFCFTFGVRGVVFNIIYLSTIGETSISKNAIKIGLLILKIIILFFIAQFFKTYTKSDFLSIIILFVLFVVYIWKIGLSKQDRNNLMEILVKNK